MAEFTVTHQHVYRRARWLRAYAFPLNGVPEFRPIPVERTYDGTQFVGDRALLSAMWSNSALQNPRRVPVRVQLAGTSGRRRWEAYNVYYTTLPAPAASLNQSLLDLGTSLSFQYPGEFIVVRRNRRDEHLLDMRHVDVYQALLAVRYIIRLRVERWVNQELDSRS
ncbi:hypothetical protein ONZ51_g7822 [Trametes cubensis]|uniref:Uncharacterized protein n=1 Tax=Trametes cubensis TaxID=1111947 RepID=A0AAD7TQM7_9APHY|nr:hypothetical protein ONZ51_g7822 [Trametes cubensis]